MEPAGYRIFDLTIGERYVALAMVWRNPDAPVVLLSSDDQTFGPPVIAADKWVETRLEFVAKDTVQTIGLVRRDTHNGLVFMGKFLCTKWPYNGGYFDGASGNDYSWGKLHDASTSLYYPDRTNRTYIIHKLLQENSPLGIMPEATTYAAAPKVLTSGDQWILDTDHSILGRSTYI